MPTRVIILALVSFLLLQACGGSTPPVTSPAAISSTPNSTQVDLVSSPQPADQSAALLPGFPPIAAGLTHYSIRIELDPTGRSFTSHTRVDYTNGEDVPLQALYFRLYPNFGESYGDGKITINSAYVDELPVAPIMSLLDSVVEISLSTPLEPGNKAQIDFDTAGTIPQDFGAGGESGGYGIYNHTQGVLALANFYPILAVYDAGGWRLDPVYGFGDSVYSDAALYTVEVWSDPGLVIATSGIQVGQEDLGGRVMHRYISGPARDFFIIASPDYQVSSRKLGGTTVSSYYLPQHNEGGTEALDTAIRSLEIYSSLFGQYPYKEYSVVEAPLSLPSGVEYPVVGLIADRLYTNINPTVFDTTVAHEVAHQWWYNIVGNDVIRAPWMDEALATYSSILYWEKQGGAGARDQILAYYSERYDQNIQEGLDAPVTEPLAYFKDGSRTASYSPVVYAKGALFFNDLRQVMGDEAFFKALQFYYGSHWFSLASTNDLITAFQNASSVPLDSLYQTWLYSPQLGTPTPTPTLTQTSMPSPTATPVLTATPTPTPTVTPMATPLIFAAIGDYGGGNRGEERVADLIKSWVPEFIITLGDNNYPVGARDHIDQAIGQYFHGYIYPYIGSYGEGADINRFFPTIGNHDMQSERGQPYYDYFTLPGNERYYDFVWGPAHFFALDSLDSEPDGVGASSVQAEWLRQALAESNSPWNIVYFHYPPYSSGLHGSTDWMRWPFAEWGADAVLAGHDHTYERLLEESIPYFVNGMGGYDMYEFRDILDGSMVRYVGDFGAMRMETTETYLKFEFINLSGEVVDSYELGK